MHLSQKSASAGAVTRTVHRLRDANHQVAHDDVADEVPIAFEYNDTPFAVMMATPHDLADFALGFSLSEGIVATPDELTTESIDIWIDGAVLRLRIPTAATEALQNRRRNLQGRSGCGVCGSESIEAVLQPPAPVSNALRIEAQALQRAMQQLRERQPLNAATGATHAAAWATSGGVVACVREDIGRHNALDKLIGALHHSDLDPASGFAVITSRASYEMTLKAARAGIELIAAISAPTALAIALADSAGQTLIGFARGADCVIYTHPHRLLEAGVQETPA
ncbi:MAG: formate dehydrogenase accessory sulfurtransferase FdhD [Pseudomarimonas sp.]